jgi:hypothetical protein
MFQKFMNNEKRKKDVKEAINEALKHEENLQHDENERPITFVNKKQVKSIEHEDHVLNDENEDPKTFADNL